MLYVSTHFSTAAHSCACGCGREVITPLSPGQWVLAFDGSVSLWPSIGNWTLPCRSHYVIDHSTISWAQDFTREQVLRNQAADDHALSSARQPAWRRVLGRLFGSRR
ncbi:DUF6527 family protein [Naasia aerilata]|uniref:DUF6527 family protein n=1 Tax=Naasia aerilata TaxID=1162966 RepID=UPI003305D5E5